MGMKKGSLCSETKKKPRGRRPEAFWSTAGRAVTARKERGGSKGFLLIASSTIAKERSDDEWQQGEGGEKEKEEQWRVAKRCSTDEGQTIRIFRVRVLMRFVRLGGVSKIVCHFDHRKWKKVKNYTLAVL